MGKRGVLLTCMGGKEMQAGRDAVRILTQVRQANLWQGAAKCFCGCIPACNCTDGQRPVQSCSTAARLHHQLPQLVPGVQALSHVLVWPQLADHSSRGQTLLSLISCRAVL